MKRTLGTIITAIILTALTTATAQVQFGMYTYGGVWSGTNPIERVEQDLGTHVGIVHYYHDASVPFDANLLQPLVDSGRTPLISWQTTSMPLNSINSGQYDSEIRAWAEAAAAFGHELHFRPFPEMNGNWTPWNGNPQALVTAWQRIHGIFQAAGATNVLFMFSPNITDEPSTPENAMELYWPGSDYVDTLALDGFNWGTTRDHTAWKTFDETFTGPYQRITQLDANAPVWLAEVGSTEVGGDKAQWVRDMFTSTSMPRVEAIIWFNENKETDWRINSSAATLAAFQQQLANAVLANR